MAGEGRDGDTECQIGKSESEAGNLCAQAVADTYGPNACKLEPSTSQAPGWLPGLQICGSDDAKTLPGKTGADGKSHQVDGTGKSVDPQTGDVKKFSPDSASELHKSHQVDGTGKPVDPQTGDVKKVSPDSASELHKSQQVDGTGKPVDPSKAEVKKPSDPANDANFQQYNPDGKPADPRTGGVKKSSPDSESGEHARRRGPSTSPVRELNPGSGGAPTEQQPPNQGESPHPGRLRGF